jgi:hypothetical protein
MFVIVTLAAQRRGFPFWVESQPIREVLESDESDVGATTIPAHRTHFVMLGGVAPAFVPDLVSRPVSQISVTGGVDKKGLEVPLPRAPHVGVTGGRFPQAGRKRISRTGAQRFVSQMRHVTGLPDVSQLVRPSVFPRGLIARSFAMRWTVPVPMPSDLATFKIPTPFASCFRTSVRSCCLSSGGRASRPGRQRA